MQKGLTISMVKKDIENRMGDTQQICTHIAVDGGVSNFFLMLAQKQVMCHIFDPPFCACGGGACSIGRWFPSSLLSSLKVMTGGHF